MNPRGRSGRGPPRRAQRPATTNHQSARCVSCGNLAGRPEAGTNERERPYLVKGRNKAYYNRIAQRAMALKRLPPVNPDWGVKDEPEFDRPPSVNPDWGDDFKHEVSAESKVHGYSPFNKTDLDLGGGGVRHETPFNLIREREKNGTCYKGQNCPGDFVDTWKNVRYSTCKNIGSPRGFGSWKGDNTMRCANF